jgi:hypothetical protein
MTMVMLMTGTVSEATMGMAEQAKLLFHDFLSLQWNRYCNWAPLLCQALTLHVASLAAGVAAAGGDKAGSVL